MTALSPRTRAAQYLRMSTEHQNYSLEYQGSCNAAYALQHGYELVRTYTDAGVSGLRLKGREGLKQLLADACSGAADYDAVLVYDVSRWGRFQDVDQGAHYEFVCREAGVQVIYTAEPFSADGSLVANLLKNLKRAMAAEFSRDLSAKTGRAQRGLRLKGYWQGGPPGYGFRRVAVRLDRTVRVQMEHGQQKALRGDRTVLVPGPAAEIEVVRRIYSLYVVGGLRRHAIAHLLNQEGVPAEGGARWTTHRVEGVLTHEKYVGVLVCGKSIATLGERRLQPRAAWVRVEDAVEPLIPRAMFDLAQAQRRRPKARGESDEALLSELRQVWADHGRLSTLLIDAHPQAHCSEIYKRRFGSMEGAYARIGYTPSPRQTAAAAKARLHRPHAFRPRPEVLQPGLALDALGAHLRRLGCVSCTSIDDDPGLPSSDWYRRQFGGMAKVYALLGYAPTARQLRHMALGAGHRPTEV